MSETAGRRWLGRYVGRAPAIKGEQAHLEDAPFSRGRRVLARFVDGMVKTEQRCGVKFGKYPPEYDAKDWEFVRWD
jgi:hypothetical protein